ncbi:MAG TPA: XdhC family protein [Pyrinomonadaceae bacterium]|nr:XdhC family protein [Pyrinomonadaceae bacterium]
MNETRAIIEAFDESQARGDASALATLVSVEGSAYRRPGARMLVTKSGASTGTISAGCLESDVIEHAQHVIKTNQTKLIEYDTTSTNEEIVWGLGLGCNGVVRVLVEPLAPQSSYLAALRRTLAEQLNIAPLVVATVFHHSSSGSTPTTARVGIGARLCLNENGEIQSADALSGELATMIERDARAALREETSGVRVYEQHGATTKVFIETITPPVPLVVFGAGHDALPIIELARGLGWQTEVVDVQERSISRARFAGADKVTLARAETINEQVGVTARTLALVMTHNYAHDQLLLRFLLSSPARYVGVMGPRKRTERMLNELAESDRSSRLQESHMSRLYAPVGLDIGANTPTEIALSIIAEMRAVVAAREGGHLCRRRAPIHDGQDAAAGGAGARPAQTNA